MKKKILTLIIAACLSVSLIACNNETVTDNNQSGNNIGTEQNLNDNDNTLKGSDVVVSFGNHDLTVGELYSRFIVYAYTNSVTSENMNDVNIEYIVIDLIKNAQIEIAEYNKAIESGIEFTDELKNMSIQQAESFMTFMGPTFMEKYGIEPQMVYDYFDMQTVVSVYMNEIYNDKVEELIPEYQTKYADYEFEKVYRALFSFLEIDSEGNVTIDPYGNYAVLDDDKKAEIYKNAEEFLSEINEDATNMEELIKKYGIEESSGVDYLFKGEAEDPVSLALRDLGEGDHSDIITTDMGYAIIRVDNINDTEIKDAMLKKYAGDEAKQYVEDKMSDIKTEIYLDMKTADDDLKAKLQILDILKTLEANDFGY